MTAYPSNNPVVRLTVELSGGRVVTVNGRDAWALNALIESGPSGVTPLENPAPRWSHYVFKLRGVGLTVETIDEGHGGAFSGTHARYVLRTQLRTIGTIRQADQSARPKRRRSPSVVPAEPSEFEIAAGYEAAERARLLASNEKQTTTTGQPNEHGNFRGARAS